MADFAASEQGRHHRSERLGHALYGLIIVTSTLVAEKAHIEEPAVAMELLAGIALVLVLAHTYSSWMAERVTGMGGLGKLGRRMVVLDNLPVGLAIIVPMLLFSAAGLDLIGLQTAYVLSIIFSLVALAAVGIYQGRSASMSWGPTLLGGAAAVTIGFVVIAVEVLFE